MYLQVGSLVAGRDLVVAGTTIAAGSELTSEQLGQITTLSALLGNGSIVATPDPYARKTQDGNPQPTYVNPGAYRTLKAALIAAETPPPAPPEE